MCTQNYFDPRGVFAMMMYSGPLLVLLTFILGNIVYQSMQMLVIVKKAQLKEKYKRQGEPIGQSKKEQISDENKKTK